MKKDSQINDYYNRFPSVLKKALLENKVRFPEELEKNFTPITAYRGIRFIEGKKEFIDKNDFLSQAERELPGTNYDDIYEYSCSCYEDIDELWVAFKLPRKNKRIARGIIECKNGPIIKEKDTTHIHWFLFEDTVPNERFEVYEYEKMD